MPKEPLFIGAEVPDFTLPTITGADTKLSHFRGNHVILFMWASW